MAGVWIGMAVACGVAAVVGCTVGVRSIRHVLELRLRTTDAELRNRFRSTALHNTIDLAQHAKLGNVSIERSDVRPRPDEQTLGGRDDSGARRARLQIPDRRIVQVRDIQVHARRAERRSRDE